MQIRVSVVPAGSWQACTRSHGSIARWGAWRYFGRLFSSGNSSIPEAGNIALGNTASLSSLYKFLNKARKYLDWHYPLLPKSDPNPGNTLWTSTHTTLKHTKSRLQTEMAEQNTSGKHLNGMKIADVTLQFPIKLQERCFTRNERGIQTLFLNLMEIKVSI